MDRPYVHGYDAAESARLNDQAGALEALLHDGTAYPPGSAVLEAGCGVGAQTVALARRSPGARFTCVDVSAASLAEARRRTAGLADVRFRQANLLALPFAEASFDHVFLCFVLEHLADPAGALAALRRVLRPDGTITVIEGDHGSVLLHPESAAARAAVAAQVELQLRAGGDPMIGRRLFPLLAAAGFRNVLAAPLQVYADGARPHLQEGFTRRTFAAMVEGVRATAMAAGLLDAAAFDAGIAGLHRAAEPDGTFAYTFFRAVAVR